MNGWQPYALLVATLAALVAVGAAVIRPLEARMDTVERGSKDRYEAVLRIAEANARAIGGLRSSHEGISEILNEIETQFRSVREINAHRWGWMRDVENLRDAHNREMIAILYKKVMGDTLPDRHFDPYTELPPPSQSPYRSGQPPQNGNNH